MLHLWWNKDANRNTRARTHAARDKHDGVVEPDNRVVFVALAAGMIVGALLLSPAKTPETPVALKAPGASAK